MSKIQHETLYHGIAASSGIAIGTIFMLGSRSLQLNQTRKEILQEDVEQELALFQNALKKTREQISNIQNKIKSNVSSRDLAIFDAHLLIVDDRALISETEALISKELVSANYAFSQIISRYINILSALTNQYIKERVQDVEDVAYRILANLKGTKLLEGDYLPGQRIILSKALTPSETALLDKENVQGFVIGSGSQTSHTAILASSMKLPAIVGLHNIFDEAQSGDIIIIDGFTGTVILNPTEETQELFLEKEMRNEQYFTSLLSEKDDKSETTDGYTIQLAANLEDINDIEDVNDFGAHGIGLFRTEYLYINTIEPPSSEEQFKIFKRAAQNVNGNPVVIRTMDIGGDKLHNLSTLTDNHEQNPFLGSRAIRLCLEENNIEIFKAQIKAILRASAFGDVKIMFPMITCLDEVYKAKGILEEVKVELDIQGIAFNKNIDVGIMIETPSAAMLSDHLAKVVDFFSIGTNDLVQYTLAVDRSNEKVAYLYQPSHPSILRLINQVVLAAKKNRIWVSLCGAMAGDPLFTPILAGLGINELSMSPVSIGPIKRIVRKLEMYEVEILAKEAMKCSSASETLNLSKEMLYNIAPEIMDITTKGL